MKAVKLNTLITRIFLGTFILLFFFSADVSAKKIKFPNSSVVPFARGYVKINKDKYNSYIIKIRLTNLVEAYRLQPPKLNYIVWIFTDEAITMNMGKMDSSIRLITKRLKASFQTTSTLKPIRLFITAEDDPSRQYPGEQEVLSTNIFKI